jgi:hypothetical protein
MDGFKCNGRNVARTALAASLISALALWSSPIVAAADDAQAQAQQSWREAMVRTDVPAEGCFYASYPSSTWTKVGCGVAPNLPYPPRSSSIGQTVGDGADYAVEIPGLMTRNIGFFPDMSGVKSEKDGSIPNSYSLQLNSNFMTTAACKIKGCITWQQFVYSSGSHAAFMQYWEINHGHPCASGWIVAGATDCYKNSAAAAVPLLPIKDLTKLEVSGAAVKGGLDTMIFSNGTTAYSVSGKDSVVDLATDWHQSEFNVIGDCCASQAVFNKGSTLQVDIEIINGTTAAPHCIANAGTTGETNNLNLKSCATFPKTGSLGPSLEFVESN